jgi:hypothetical protein
MKGEGNDVGDIGQSVTHVAFPGLDDHPVRPFQVGTLSSVALPVELELPRPEVWIGLRKVRVAPRAVVPETAVDENG